MDKPDGGPAFPGTNGAALQGGMKRLMEAALAHDEAETIAAFQVVTEAVKDGMSLRDYFAGQALTGLAIGDRPDEKTARIAYEMADALIAARNR